MGHVFSGKTITTRFQVVNEEICLIYSGNWKGDCVDVYREFESGRCESRYLYSTSFGYQFAIPGEKISRNYYSGYYGQKQEHQDFCECCRYDFYSDFLEESEKELICSVYSDFIYTLNKWKGWKPKKQVLEALRYWKTYPMIEMLIATNHKNIAFNKSFYRLTEKKKKEIILFLKEHSGDYTLQEVQTMMKYKISPQILKQYQTKKNIAYGMSLSFPEYDFLMKTNQFTEEAAIFYRDYKKMLKDSTHSMKDPYWLFPKDIHAMHNRLLKEEKERESMMKKEKNEKYIEKVKDLFQYKKNIDGFDVYVPEDLTEWIYQARELHQCILYAKYDDKVINGNNYCLVFIRKEGFPIATAEIIGKEKRIGQFYVDEYDRGNCRPTEDLQIILKKWLDDFSFEKAA